MATGSPGPIFQTIVPAWNPLRWTGNSFSAVWHDTFGTGAYIGGPAVRTLLYTAVASALSIAIA